MDNTKRKVEELMTAIDRIVENQKQISLDLMKNERA